MTRKVHSFNFLYAIKIGAFPHFFGGKIDRETKHPGVCLGVTRRLHGATVNLWQMSRLYERTPQRWVDLHDQFLRGACLTLHLIPGRLLPSRAYFRFRCGAKLRRNFVYSKLITLKNRKYTKILPESRGGLVFYPYLCKRKWQRLDTKRTRAPLMVCDPQKYCVQGVFPP